MSPSAPSSDRPPPAELSSALDRAAEAIRGAGALVLGAGAGMGVDSGLPDFRGTEGFWRAYPPFARLGLAFEEMANPAHFAADPALAWGFYGHRLHLYRDTPPHRGFEILRRWAGEPGREAFVFTSNIDGHFQRSGFAETRVLECHGSLEHLQCVDPCGDHLWSAEGTEIAVDPETFRAAEPLPRCPGCGGLARPNVLMFGDWLWVAERTEAQHAAFRRWLGRVAERPLVLLEMGAGSAVPTVRRTFESLAASLDAPLVRINPREAAIPASSGWGSSRGISLPLGALEALTAIDERLKGRP